MDYTHIREINDLLNDFVIGATARDISIEQPRLNEITLRDTHGRGHVRLLATSTGIDIMNCTRSRADGYYNSNLCDLQPNADPIDTQFVNLFDNYFVTNTTICIGMHTHRALELGRYTF